MEPFIYTETWGLKGALSDLSYEHSDTSDPDDVNWKLEAAVQEYRQKLTEEEWLALCEEAGQSLYLSDKARKQGYGQEDYENFIEFATEHFK